MSNELIACYDSHMNALIFGGMSPRHKEWVRQVAAALESQFEAVKFLDYKHWDAPEADMDLEYETAQAAKLAEGLGDYVVVAKSIGSVLTALANARGTLSPKRCLFLGFPYNVATKLPQTAELEAALPRLPHTVFVHNEHDPLGEAETVQSYMQAHAPDAYEFQIIPGNATHDYVDFDQIVRLAAN